MLLLLERGDLGLMTADWVECRLRWQWSIFFNYVTVHAVVECTSNFPYEAFFLFTLLYSFLLMMKNFLISRYFEFAHISILLSLMKFLDVEDELRQLFLDLTQKYFI